jgi:hypothetical protein
MGFFRQLWREAAHAVTASISAARDLDRIGRALAEDDEVPDPTEIEDIAVWTGRHRLKKVLHTRFRSGDDE